MVACFDGGMNVAVQRVTHPPNTTRKMQKSTAFCTDKLCKKNRFTGSMGVQFSDLNLPFSNLANSWSSKMLPLWIEVDVNQQDKNVDLHLSLNEIYLLLEHLFMLTTVLVVLLLKIYDHCTPWNLWHSCKIVYSFGILSESGAACGQFSNLNLNM